MTESQKKIRAPFLLLFFLSAIVATALRCAAVLGGTPSLLGATGWILAISALVLLCYPLAARGEPVASPRLHTAGAARIPAALTSVGLAFVGIEVFRSVLPVIGDLLRHTQASVPLAIFGALAGVLAFVGIGYFLFLDLVGVKESAARAFFGMGAALFFAVYAVYLYFDTARAIGDPHKILDQMTYLSFAVFLLLETRISLGKDKSGFYFSCALIAAMLATVDGIPALLSDLIRGVPLSTGLFETVLTLSMMLFLFTRIVLASNPPSKTPRGFAATLARAAEKRAEEIEAADCPDDPAAPEIALASETSKQDEEPETTETEV